MKRREQKRIAVWADALRDLAAGLGVGSANPRQFPSLLVSAENQRRIDRHKIESPPSHEASILRSETAKDESADASGFTGAEATR